MPRSDFRLELLPAFSDNYIYLLIHTPSGEALAIDPGEAPPVEHFLSAQNLTLRSIWLTHHHNDHTGGVEALRRRHGCEVVGHAADAYRLPRLDRAVSEGDSVDFHGMAFSVISLPGHTLGHIGYHGAELKLLFCGDTLFSLGCGRLFEGNPAQMRHSLARLAALPANTAICAGHEYTLTNARFALTIDPQNPALLTRMKEATRLRSQDAPTLPALLSEELSANPFLRTESVEAFAELRKARDHFS